MRARRMFPCAIAIAMAAGPMADSHAWGSEIRDTRYGYSVSPPEFAAVPVGAMATRFSAAAPPDAGFASNMGVMIQEIQTTREQFIEQSKKQLDGVGFTLRSSTKAEVSGQPAVVWDYQGEMGGQTLRFLQLAVILPERVVLVTYTAPVSEFTRLEGEFRRSLKSFRLGPK